MASPPRLGCGDECWAGQVNQELYRLTRRYLISKRSELREIIPQERARLVRDLADLPTEAWERPSLCEGWKVRDVVAHLVRSDEAYRRGYPLLVDLVRGGFRPQTALAKAARRRAARMPPGDLVAALDRTRYEIGVRVHPTPAVPLGELLIHGQDIRRALSVPHDVPPSAFLLAADGALTIARRLFGWGRAPKGVRLEATDIDWSTGSGDIARGSIEAIAMVLAGRRSALSDLEGPGAAALSSQQGS